MASIRVYLVPGFFGFVSLGAFNYFHRVGDALGQALQRRGIDAEIVECATQPTGSIRRRAARVVDFVEETGGMDASEVHFVGHSTGGLDLRLVTTPGVRLRPDDSEERLGERVKSVISVCSPHFGTPLANHFTSLQGRHVLQLLTLLATSRSGRQAFVLAGRALSRLSGLDDWMGRNETFLDVISHRLLDRLTVDKNHPMWGFLQEVYEDQGALIQLTPEGTNLFNAAVTDREGVYYGSLVAAAPPPLAYPMRELVRPGRGATIVLFAALHRLAAREHKHYPYPSPAHELRDRVQRDLPFDLDASTNDGIVPTLSQIYGELIGVSVGDHLDVVGQFRMAGGEPYMDWLPSGSRFDEERFQKVWDQVAAAIERARG